MRRLFGPWPLRPLAAVAIALLACTIGPQALASTDHYTSALWGMKKVRAEAAWSSGTGQGVTIAIVDSGVDMSHEDLSANVVAGYDFVDRDADPSDEAGHGTHVAGIAAAVANNKIGVAGVAPQAKIMPVRVLDENGEGSLSDIEEGVRWAVDHGADIVNLSLGSDFLTEFLTGGTLTDAVNYAWSKGAIAVVSAGNEQLFRSELRKAKAMIVTATTPSDAKASYATGAGFAPWGISAPGGTNEGGEKNMILSTWWEPDSPGGGAERRYAYSMGTSMAVPHVSGAAAVLRGLGFTPQRTVERLLQTARDLGSNGRDNVFGHGLLDVAAASRVVQTGVAAQAGSEGEPGQDGSSAEGSAATGRPGSSASGARGAPGDVPGSGGGARSTPSLEPSPAGSPERTSEADSSGDGSPVGIIVAAVAAAAAAVGVVLYVRRRRAPS